MKKKIKKILVYTFILSFLSLGVQFTGVGILKSNTVFAASENFSMSKTYCSIVGQQQGTIKGNITQLGKQGLIGIKGFTQTSERVIDDSTSASDRSMNKGIFQLVKEIDIASPKIMRAMKTGEILRDVTLNTYISYNISGTSTEYITYTIKLKNAVVVSRKIINTQGLAGKINNICYEEISFTYDTLIESDGTNGISKLTSNGIKLGITAQITGETQGLIKGYWRQEDNGGNMAIESFSEEIQQLEQSQDDLDSEDDLDTKYERFNATSSEIRDSEEFSHLDFIFVKQLDKASPKLKEAFENEETLTNVTLNFQNMITTVSTSIGSSQKFYTINLKNAKIISRRIFLNTEEVIVANSRIYEEITLQYESIEEICLLNDDKVMIINPRN